MEVATALLLSIGTINSISVLLYAVTSFGNAILFHIGWHCCSLLTSGHICQIDNLPLTVVYITFAGVVLFPGQLFKLRKWINWPLAIHIALGQQIGLVFGIYVLFNFQSIWISRVLGITFFIVAAQKACTHSDSLPAPIASVSDEHPESDDPASAISATQASYVPYSVAGTNLALVYLVGISSGVFGGMLGTGGPPLVWFASYAKLNSVECRSTFALGYMCETISRLIYIFFVQTSLKGLASLSSLYIFLVLSVTSLLGLQVGNMLALRMVHQATFQAMLIVLLAGGSVLIGTQGMDGSYTLVVSLAAGLVFGLIFAARRCRRVKDAATGTGDAAKESNGAGAAGSNIFSSSTGNPVYALTKHNLLTPQQTRKSLSRYDTVRQWDDAAFGGDDEEIDFSDNLDSRQHGRRGESAVFSSFSMFASTSTDATSSKVRGNTVHHSSQSRQIAGNAQAASKGSSSTKSSFFSGPPSAAFYSVLPQSRGAPPPQLHADEDDQVLF